jgi:hypothetical protein
VTITPGQNILASIKGQTLNSNFDAIAPLTYLLTNKKDIWECLPDQILCKTATVLRDMLNSLATTPDSKLSHSYDQSSSGQGWDWIMFNSEGVIKSEVLLPRRGHDESSGHFQFQHSIIIENAKQTI